MEHHQDASSSKVEGMLSALSLSVNNFMEQSVRNSNTLSANVADIINLKEIAKSLKTDIRKIESLLSKQKDDEKESLDDIKELVNALRLEVLAKATQTEAQLDSKIEYTQKELTVKINRKLLKEDFKEYKRVIEDRLSKAEKDVAKNSKFTHIFIVVGTGFVMFTSWIIPIILEFVGGN